VDKTAPHYKDLISAAMIAMCEKSTEIRWKRRQHLRQVK